MQNLSEAFARLDSFVERITPHAKAEYNRTAQIALGLAKIRIERRDKKIDSLIARLRHSGGFVPNIRDPHDNWEAPAAANALSEIGDSAFPALKERYEELRKQKDDRDIYGKRMWVLYAIGLSKNQHAKAYLESLLHRGEQNKNNARRAIGVGIDVIRHVVTLQKEGLPSPKSGPKTINRRPQVRPSQ